MGLSSMYGSDSRVIGNGRGHSNGNGNYAHNSPPDDISQAKIIAVMGMTGSGKSTFIQKLTGKAEVTVGDGLHSCTQKPQLVRFNHNGHSVILIDTPGFDDTFRTDADVLQDVAEVLMLTYSQNARLSGIIYLHRIIDPRITHGGMRNLQMFRKLCGPDPMRNVLLATTFWGQADMTQAQIRLDDLQTDPDFWAEMIEEGARIDRFDNDHASALRLVLDLVGREKVDLQIQQEMSSGRMLSETSAGEALHHDLLELQHKHAEEIQKLKQEMDEARKDQDERLEMRLRRNAMRHERELEVLHAQQQRLGQDRREEIRALEQHFNLQLRRLELQKEQEADAKLEEASQRTKLDNQSVSPPTSPLSKPSKSNGKPDSPLSPADAAKKKAKQKKAIEVVGTVLGAGAMVGGCFLNPMMLPSAIDAFVRLANTVFGNEPDPAAGDPGQEDPGAEAGAAEV